MCILIFAHMHNTSLSLLLLLLPGFADRIVYSLNELPVIKYMHLVSLAQASWSPSVCGLKATVALVCASKPGILPGAVCTNRGSLTSPSHKKHAETHRNTTWKVLQKPSLCLKVPGILPGNLFLSRPASLYGFFKSC